MIKIPLYNRKGIILKIITFIDNLTLRGQPAYMNEGGQIGIKRLKSGEYAGRLVYMYYDPFYSSASRADFISEEEAYTMCLNRGRLNLVEEFNISPDYSSFMGV